MKSYYKQAEEQLARVGMTLQTLEDADPLLTANAAHCAHTINDFLVSALKTACDERDAAIGFLKTCRDACKFCLHNRTGARARICYEQDYMCASCPENCPCKHCRGNSAWQYGNGEQMRRESQPVANAKEGAEA